MRKLAIQLFVGTLLTGAAIVAVADPFGSNVGSFQGVPAYSNGTNGTASNQYNTVNGYRTGMKWQCVEYVSRFYWLVYGRQIAGGNANSFYGNGKGLNRRANGGSVRPQVGDILCSASGGYGHVAIVREVGSNYIVVIHQNWANTSADNAKRMTMTVSNGRYTVAAAGSYSWQGWLSRS